MFTFLLAHRPNCLFYAGQLVADCHLERSGGAARRGAEIACLALHLGRGAGRFNLLENAKLNYC